VPGKLPRCKAFRLTKQEHITVKSMQQAAHLRETHPFIHCFKFNKWIQNRAFAKAYHNQSDLYDHNWVHHTFALSQRWQWFHLKRRPPHYCRARAKLQQNLFDKMVSMQDLAQPKFLSNTLWCILLFIYLFNDNLATGGSLTGAILSCHVELW